MKPRYKVILAAIVMGLLMGGAVYLDSERQAKLVKYCADRGMILVETAYDTICIKGEYVK